LLFQQRDLLLAAACRLGLGLRGRQRAGESNRRGCNSCPAHVM